MSNNRLVFEGLAELKEGLRNLPKELHGEASNIALGAANGAAVEIKRGYEQTAQSLAEAVVVKRDLPGPYAAGAQVITRHKLAWIFENGTQVRHTAFGANRGAMRPQHVFVPPVMRARVRMYQDLMELLRRKGLVVSGG